MKNGYGTNKISTKESSGMKKSRIMKTTVLLLAMVLLMGVFPAGCAGKESGTESSGQGQITGSSRQEQATGSAVQGQEPRDGTFQPSLFRAEGGTGKVKITCEEVPGGGRNRKGEDHLRGSHREGWRGRSHDRIQQSSL